MPLSEPRTSGRAAGRSPKRAIALGIAAALLAPIAATAAATAASAADHHDHGHIAAEYTLALLNPSNNGVASSALDINDQGNVVGITRPTASAQPQSTILWEAHGDHFHAHELANLEGSAFSRGFALNNSGTVVGEAFNSAGNTIPIKWDADGTPTHVTTLNEVGNGILNDIDDAGTAVGGASSRAVQLAADGQAHYLAEPALEPGTTLTRSVASAISAAGTAGRITLAEAHGDHSHTLHYAAKWTADGVDLFPVTSGLPTINDITADGELVGTVAVGNGDTATVWDETGTAETLPLPDINGWKHSSANAGSDDGVYVGSVSLMAGFPSFGAAAVAWDAHGPVDLNTRVAELPEGVTLQAANGINAAGQIVGSAQSGDGTRGFILTPVPEDDPAIAPQITEQPKAVTIDEGGDASFSAAASGTPAPSVQWEQSSDGESWTPVEGATENALTVTGVAAAQNGTHYRAVFTNTAGSATTEAAILTVTARTGPTPGGDDDNTDDDTGDNGGNNTDDDKDTGGDKGTDQDRKPGNQTPQPTGDQLPTTGSEIVTPLVAGGAITLLAAAFLIASAIRRRVKARAE